MENKSFFKEVMLFESDNFTDQGCGLLMWIVILLTIIAISLSVWLAVAHPNEFEYVMRTWGLYLG